MSFLIKIVYYHQRDLATAAEFFKTFQLKTFNISWANGFFCRLVRISRFQKNTHSLEFKF